MNISDVRKIIKKLRNKKKAALLQRYFKTGPGEYAEGDIFYGITVPVSRKLAVRFKELKLEDIIGLLKSPVHEERLVALIILISKYRKSDIAGREKIYSIYLNHTRYINNWDLVDVTAKCIVGDFLFNRNKAPLYALARSPSVWERRIAVLSTFYFIGKNEFSDALKIARMLLSDEHDLIHKASGWMLREVGKRNMAAEEGFLKKYSKKMPRTMLRYAIEKFPEHKRRVYLCR